MREEEEDEFPGWRQGKNLLAPTRCSLASRCIRCGRPPTVTVKQAVYWHPPGWYALILLGVVIYVAAVNSISQHAELELGLCAEHAAAHKRRRHIAWAIMAASPLFIVLAIVVGSVVLGILAPFVLLAGMAALLLARRVVRVDRIHNGLVSISNAGPELLASLDDTSSA